eukprot:67263-Pyramimonas_sp.AAC.1
MFPDAPPDEWVPQSFLFALKRCSVEWDYDGKCAWVDIPSKSLHVGGGRVINAGVDGADLITDVGEGWGDFLRCEKLEDMMGACKEKLKRSLAPNKGKGIG